MKWFDTYVSNTIGGTGNQLACWPSSDEAVTGRVYYRIFSGGSFHYSLLFSNIIDITYMPEFGSNVNMLPDEWEILSGFVGVCSETDCEHAGYVEHLIPLTFNGCAHKTVAPGEFFTTDPVLIDADKGCYLCVQLTFRGKMLPWHRDSILPTFVLKDNEWIPDLHMPVPGMVGCDRKVKARITYFGDSITQGIGTVPNAYSHWCALTADAIGEDYAHWNLGIGHGHAHDAATNGAWMFKAKQSDIVVVTFGSNDVHKRSVIEMAQDIRTIITQLKGNGIRVFLQTLPPFEWQDEDLERWEGINAYLKETLSKEADGFLDIAPLLTDTSVPGRGHCRYGTHPDEDGCRIWAENLIPLLRKLL